MVDSIFRAAYSKYWVPEEQNQQQAKESSLKWSRNESNAVADGQRTRDTSYRISAWLLKKAVTILRSVSLNFRQSEDTIFKWSFPKVMAMHRESWKRSSNGYWLEQMISIQLNDQVNV